MYRHTSSSTRAYVLVHERSSSGFRTADRATSATAEPLFEAALIAGGKLQQGAPVIGYLIADADIVIRHARADGKPTGEHAEIKRDIGGYLVLGKREWTADDERRVAD